MYELVKISKQCYYISSPAKIGVYLENDNNVYLIDSGNDKNAGRKIRQILDSKNWNLKGILNTHSNADHIGGNNYLQRQTGCKIYSNGIESAFIKYPILEPSFLYGGYPCKDLRHKFLMAKGSEVIDFTDSSFPKEVEIIPLEGHFFDMVGFKMIDDTVFLADCISSVDTLNKYAIPFIYDVDAYIKTLDMVEKIDAKIFVPSHAEVIEDIAAIVSYNRNKVYEVAEKILFICKDAINFENILQKVFNEYNLNLNFEQYVLVGSTVRSYLSWLKDSGKINVIFENNMLLWERM